jgi:uncharacterized protein (UPF0548 family)
MFFLSRPSVARIESILRSQKKASLRYKIEGSTRDYHSTQVGSGEQAFRAAKFALQNWEMMDLGWLHAVPTDGEVAIVIQHYGFWSVNVARVLYTRETASMYTMAYGTLPEHAESGEERFTVTRREDGSVWYEVEAFSRPRHLLAKIGYPLTRALQKRFAQDSLRRMQLICGRG